MPWVAIDDRFPQHPKVKRLAREIRAAACWLFVSALCYSNAEGTDGQLQHDDVFDLYTLGDHDPIKLAEALVRVRLWEKTPDGFAVHDYADYQLTAAAVHTNRVSQHAAKVAAGKARAAIAQRIGGRFVSPADHQQTHQQTIPAGDCAGENATSRPEEKPQVSTSSHQQATSRATSSAPADHQPPSPSPLRDKTPSLTHSVIPIEQESGKTGADARDSKPVDQAARKELKRDTDDALAYYAEKRGCDTDDLSADVRSSVARWVRVYGRAMALEAIGEGKMQGEIRNLSYIGGCLKRWTSTGTKA